MLTVPPIWAGIFVLIFRKHFHSAEKQKKREMNHHGSKNTKKLNRIKADRKSERKQSESIQNKEKKREKKREKERDSMKKKFCHNRVLIF